MFPKDNGLNQSDMASCCCAVAICVICFTGGIAPMHIVYFYVRLYSFYGPCGPEIKLYYYYYY